MREYKFRAWNKKDKKMYSWSDLIGAKGVGIFTWIEAQKNRLNNVLMQFTGLQDKNGKDIYEGDIFIFNDIVSIVKWSKSGYSIKRDKDYYIDKYYYCTLSAKCDLGEVIGNIYENKDLI